MKYSCVYLLSIILLSLNWIGCGDDDNCKYPDNGTVINLGASSGCGFVIRHSNKELLQPTNWNQFAIQPYDGQEVEFSYFGEGITGQCPVDEQITLECIRGK